MLFFLTFYSSKNQKKSITGSKEILKHKQHNSFNTDNKSAY